MAVNKKRAVGIIRVSKVGGREGERFLSPDDQRGKIRSFGFKLVALFEELDVSGTRPLAKRKGLLEAVELIEAGRADVLVAGYFDRLVRSSKVQQEVVDRVEAAGGEVLLADYGKLSNGRAIERLTGAMIGAVNEYLARSTGERLESNQQVAIDQGRWPVRLIPGLRKGKNGPELDPDKAEVVREAVRRRVAGSSIEDVRTYLKANGITRAYSGTMHLFGSRQLVGEIQFRDRVGRIPRIIEDDDFRALQKTTVSRGPKPKSDRLLARLGILRCGTCNSRMVVGTSHHGSTWCYRCPPFGDTCDQRMSISAHLVEPEIESWVKQELAGLTERASGGSDVAEAKGSLEQSQAALNRTITNFAAAELGAEPSAVQTLTDLRERRDQAQERLDDALDADQSLSVAITAGDWDELSLEARRDLVKALIKRIRIHPGRGVDRVEIEAR